MVLFREGREGVCGGVGLGVWRGWRIGFGVKVVLMVEWRRLIEFGDGVRGGEEVCWLMCGCGGKGERVEVVGCFCLVIDGEGWWWCFLWVVRRRSYRCSLLVVFLVGNLDFD